jgi:hypothetical protein
MGALQGEPVGGVSFARILKNMYSKALETGVYLNRDPAGDHGEDAPFPEFWEKGEILFHQEALFIREFERYVKGDSGNEQQFPQGSVGERGVTSFTGQFERQ